MKVPIGTGQGLVPTSVTPDLAGCQVAFASDIGLHVTDGAMLTVVDAKGGGTLTAGEYAIYADGANAAVAGGAPSRSSCPKPA